MSDSSEYIISILHHLFIFNLDLFNCHLLNSLLIYYHYQCFKYDFRFSDSPLILSNYYNCQERLLHFVKRFNIANAWHLLKARASSSSRLTWSMSRERDPLAIIRGGRLRPRYVRHHLRLGRCRKKEEGKRTGGGRARAANLADPKFQVIKSGRWL